MVEYKLRGQSCNLRGNVNVVKPMNKWISTVAFPISIKSFMNYTVKPMDLILSLKLKEVWHMSVSVT